MVIDPSCLAAARSASQRACQSAGAWAAAGPATSRPASEIAARALDLQFALAMDKGKFPNRHAKRSIGSARRGRVLVGAEGMVVAHLALGARLLHLRLEIAVDPGILVLELDLGAALLDAGVGAALVIELEELVAPAVPAQRQIAGAGGAAVEMLVEPLVGRHHDAARIPIDPPLVVLLHLRPQHRIALARQDDDMRPRPVLVALLVGADRKFRDMRAHGVAGEVELHVGRALAALAVVHELDADRVGDE